ncbi:MAG: UPF0182 family membrane protein [Thermoleophilia bacterium]
MGGQEGGGGTPPRKASASKKQTGGRRRLVLGLLVGLPVLLLILTSASSIYTEILWYRELGFLDVFYTRIWARLAVGAIGGLIFIAAFFSNLLLARRLSPRIRMTGRAGADDVLELIPAEDRTVTKVLLAVTLVLGFFFALGTGNLWQQVLLYINRVPFGYSDPVFGRDASFFVFALPVAERIVSFLGFTLFLTFLGTVAVYVFDRAIEAREGSRFRLAPHVKGHLSSLAAAALLVKAAGYLLSSWELVLSPRGVVFGASYTDVHAELPVLRILAVVAAIAAVIFLVNIHYRGWRLPIVAVGLLAVVWLFAGQIYPTVLQQYRVSPNELQSEGPYIEENIKATRFAFGLADVTPKPFPVGDRLTEADLAANSLTIDNIRLWDPRPLLDAYRQLQELRPYYAFLDVDVDRYHVDGAYRQLTLSGREFDQNKLDARARTWVNEHLTYTHGYGAVVSRVNGATAEGLPDFLVQDIPPRSRHEDLVITRPEIYFGEVSNEFVLVRTAAKEFDYGKGNENVYTTYEGEGGVGIGSFIRRAAFSFRFGTIKLLLNDDIQPESRIMFRRTLADRVQAIAPFFDYDRDPYLVIRDDGSLVWMWDAYTSTNRFPYSQPREGGVNYLRNSVKVVVDAYNGDVTFYQIDPADAVANAYGAVYPSLLTPGDQMPDDIRRHLRYPEDLFTIQTNVLGVYHMQDSQVFYNKEDVWQIPTEIYSGEEIPVLPYYVIMALPGETTEEFLLLQPFTPANKKNMISWVAARMDGEHYGELVVYEFPKDALVFGPAQIEARISNDPLISEQLTLWDQAGSQVIRGNLLVIPMEGSLLYVEPLYLQATGENPIPELTRVIVSYESRVVMEETLAEALDKLFGTGAGGATTTTPTTIPGGTGSTTTTTIPGSSTTTTEPGTVTTVPATTTTTTPGTPLPTDAAALAVLAQQHYEAALAAQRNGDWAEYGRQLDELGRVLQALETAAGPQG